LLDGGSDATMSLLFWPFSLALPSAANAQGGLIICGVQDGTHESYGAHIGAIHPPRMPAAEPAEPEVYKLDKKTVVAATIPPRRGLEYQAGGVCWLRRGTATSRLSFDEMMEIANNRGLLDWELQQARHATMGDIGQALRV
jgi:predicted HTH transcriptional regulator